MKKLFLLLTVTLLLTNCSGVEIPEEDKKVMETPGNYPTSTLTERPRSQPLKHGMFRHEMLPPRGYVRWSEEITKVHKDLADRWWKEVMETTGNYPTSTSIERLRSQSLEHETLP